MTNALHLTEAELEAGLPRILESPKERGSLELIVRRPRADERETLAEARLDLQTGLAGDNWIDRRSSRTEDGTPHPDTQLTLMSARVVALVARTKDRWPLAGDQLYVDLDLSAANLPPGTRLQIGAAVVEVTAQPHTGCAKFAARFGHDALRFVNGPAWKALRMRGIYAKVIEAGTIRPGDAVTKL
jgi:MOSC domain-containing protein YiiM